MKQLRVHTAVTAWAVWAGLSLWACAPGSKVPQGPDSSAAPADLADFVQVSAGGPADSVLSRCLDESATRAEVEPHAAVDPADSNHVVAAWMVNAGRGLGAIQAAASFDGGRSWTPPKTLPINACDRAARAWRSSVPRTAGRVGARRCR